MGTLANNDYNPGNWDYGAGRTWGYMAGGAVVGAVSGYVGASIATSGIPMANTAGIAAGSFVNSVGTYAYTGGQTDISVAFGVASYNFTQDEWGYLGKKGNSTLEDIGYGLGAFANLSDLYGFAMGAYGDKADKVQLQSDNHSSIYDKDGNVLLDVGTAKDSRTISNYDGVFGDEPLSFNYRADQANNYGHRIDQSPFYRKQQISNVKVDKILSYKAQLSASGKGYGFLRIFGGANMNCSGAAANALLKAGVFNVPIAVPGLLSLQMYARQYSFFSGMLVY